MCLAPPDRPIDSHYRSQTTTAKTTNAFQGIPPIRRGLTTGKVQFAFQVLSDGNGTANVARGPLADLKMMPTSRLQSKRGIKGGYAVKLTDGGVEGGCQFVSRAFLDISQPFLKLM